MPSSTSFLRDTVGLFGVFFSQVLVAVSVEQFFTGVRRRPSQIRHLQRHGTRISQQLLAMSGDGLQGLVFFSYVRSHCLPPSLPPSPSSGHRRIAATGLPHGYIHPSESTTVWVQPMSMSSVRFSTTHVLRATRIPTPSRPCRSARRTLGRGSICVPARPAPVTVAIPPPV